MNTPDQAPKNGDFVAYIEDLERRQLLSSPAAAHASTVAAMNKRPSVRVAAGANPAPLIAAAAAVKAVPIGLIAIGLVLLIAGAIFDGGIFLIALGIFLLWQAARTMIRSARAAAEASPASAAQQIASVLTAHTQRNKPAGK